MRRDRTVGDGRGRQLSGWNVQRHSCSLRHLRPIVFERTRRRVPLRCFRTRRRSWRPTKRNPRATGSASLDDLELEIGRRQADVDEDEPRFALQGRLGPLVEVVYQLTDEDIPRRPCAQPTPPAGAPVVQRRCAHHGVAAPQAHGDGERELATSTAVHAGAVASRHVRFSDGSDVAMNHQLGRRAYGTPGSTDVDPLVTLGAEAVKLAAVCMHATIGMPQTRVECRSRSNVARRLCEYDACRSCGRSRQRRIRLRG